MTKVSRPTMVLVDGSNVARCRTWVVRSGHAQLDDLDTKRRLVDAICSWAASSHLEVFVTFDGAGPWREGEVRVAPSVTVVGSGTQVGDDLIESLAAAFHRERRTFWLVTSDAELRHVAGARAERVIDSDQLVRELSAAHDASEPAAGPDASSPPGTQLRETLDPDTRSALERLRRGLP